jgi:hypothetical protein
MRHQRVLGGGTQGSGIGHHSETRTFGCGSGDPRTNGRQKLLRSCRLYECNPLFHAALSFLEHPGRCLQPTSNIHAAMKIQSLEAVRLSS